MVGIMPLLPVVSKRTRDYVELAKGTSGASMGFADFPMDAAGSPHILSQREIRRGRMRTKSVGWLDLSTFSINVETSPGIDHVEADLEQLVCKIRRSGCVNRLCFYRQVEFNDMSPVMRSPTSDPSNYENIESPHVYGGYDDFCLRFSGCPRMSSTSSESLSTTDTSPRLHHVGHLTPHGRALRRHKQGGTNGFLFSSFKDTSPLCGIEEPF
jgi:hypothetical protein